MSTPHKHAALIHAWADGAEIEFRLGTIDDWTTIEGPSWSPIIEYRVKPTPKPLTRTVLEWVPKKAPFRDRRILGWEMKLTEVPVESP